eukprot:Sspe_Gene.64938::Locus_38464_Transcript_1_1_Confidence_1.000_Length_3328::g.64938::m.64938
MRGGVIWRLARRAYHTHVEVPPSDSMMALLHGHQIDIAWQWMKKGVHCCWLGDFLVTMKAYELLDARIEEEWVQSHGQARSLVSLGALCAQKRLFDKMWVPNPIAVLPNSINDDGFQQWVDRLYPPANYKYLPISVVASLMESYQRFQNGVTYPFLHRTLREKASASRHRTTAYTIGSLHPLHGVNLLPIHNCAPLNLLSNWLRRSLYSTLRERRPVPHIRVFCPEAARSGGVIPLTFLGLKGFKGHIHATDPDPDCLKSLASDFSRLRRAVTPKVRATLRAEVSYLLPRNPFTRFNLAVYLPPWLSNTTPHAADFSQYYNLQHQRRSHDWLPTGAVFGDREALRVFFDDVEYRMEADGVIVVLWSNLSNIVEEDDRHPVVAELEGNTRYSLVHFEDIPWSVASEKLLQRQYHPILADLNRKLRVELWVLRVDRPTFPPPPLATTDQSDEELEDQLILAPPADDKVTPVEGKTALAEYFYASERKGPLPVLGRNARKRRRLGVQEVERDEEAEAALAEKMERDVRRSLGRKRRQKLVKLGLAPPKTRDHAAVRMRRKTSGYVTKHNVKPGL